MLPYNFSCKDSETNQQDLQEKSFGIIFIADADLVIDAGTSIPMYSIQHRVGAEKVQIMSREKLGKQSEEKLNIPKVSR